MSPPIDLGDLAPPLTLAWWQAHHLGDADVDRASVDVEATAGGVAVRAFQHTDPAMGGAFGTAGDIPVVAGWAERRARIDALAGREVRLRVRREVAGGAAVEGLAIDDVVVHGCVVHCGDGDLDADLGEACDDGDRVDGDGCDADCQLEPLPPDAATPDAATPDAGPSDAGPSDAGPPALQDAGPPDAGDVPAVPDAGRPADADRDADDDGGCGGCGASGASGATAALATALVMAAARTRRRRRTA